VAEKALSNELNRLSDLNQLMYTISDRQSLMRLSLGFALLQGKAEHGSIIFKSSIENEIGIIATNESMENDFDESFIAFKKDYFAVEIPAMNAPFMINKLDDHPLYKEFSEEAMASFLIPAWYDKEYQLANIALKRGPKLYGLLILGYRKDSGHPKESELKLLNITTSQMAISLENIILLEESREAYRRLKDLQSDTIQLEKMATKGQMSAEIGHELNNYLGVVTGNLSLMQHHLEAKNYNELGKYMKAINSNLDSIKKFTTGLVDFSGMKSVYENSDINGMISDVIDYLIVQSRFLNIDVEFRKSETPIFTYSDPSQLQQLLYNLINNAADATLERNDDTVKKIIVSTECSREKNSFRITVRDNGVGIDEAQIDKVLNERFTTKKTGHGFGLLVVRRIIENHNGSFQINSVPGQGTTIAIDFPIQSAPGGINSEEQQPVEELEKVAP
jgi:signal transduction histidine kinase